MAINFAKRWSVRALIFGVLTYVVARVVEIAMVVVFFMAVMAASHGASGIGIAVFLMVLDTLLVSFVPGLVTGWIARIRPIEHGAIIAIIIGVFSFVANYAAAPVGLGAQSGSMLRPSDEHLMLFIQPMSAMALCLLGAWLGGKIANRKAR